MPWHRSLGRDQRVDDLDIVEIALVILRHLQVAGQRHRIAVLRMLVRALHREVAAGGFDMRQQIGRAPPRTRSSS